MGHFSDEDQTKFNLLCRRRDIGAESDGSNSTVHYFKPLECTPNNLETSLQFPGHQDTLKLP